VSTVLPVDDRFARLADALADPRERHAMETMLPGYLRTQRWFGGQARNVAQASFAGWLDLALEADGCVCVVDTLDTEGVATRHQVYLGISETDGSPAVIDALEKPDIRESLRSIILQGRRLQGQGVVLSGAPQAGQEAAVEGLESALLSVEQSNTSIVFGGSCILKVYRRLEEGPHPDVELLSALGQAGFDAVPALLGAATLSGPDGLPAAAMTLQSFVPNEGDGWEWGVESARRAIDACETPEQLLRWLDADPGSVAGAEALGRVIAEMHAALASATGPDLAPLPLGPGYATDLVAEIRREAAATAELAGLALPGDTAILAAIEALGRAQAAAIAQPGLATRVHGDLHLGQLLRSAGGFVITDFEGEPARPLSERRQRQSPLVDVAGMIRSFDYAGQTAARALPGGADRTSLATAWTEAMVAAFLSAYWETAETAPTTFLPPASSRLHLLHLFELRKALYELRYELNNRPDWATIPIASIIRLGSTIA